VDLRGPSSKGREGSGIEKEGDKRERERGLEPPPLQISGYVKAFRFTVY